MAPMQRRDELSQWELEWRQSVQGAIRELQTGQAATSLAIRGLQDSVARIEKSPGILRNWLSLLITGCVGPTFGFISALLVGLILYALSRAFH